MNNILKHNDSCIIYFDLLFILESDVLCNVNLCIRLLKRYETLGSYNRENHMDKIRINVVGDKYRTYI